MIKLSIPQVPLSTNQTRCMHWAKLRREKEMWFNEVWVSLVPIQNRVRKEIDDFYKKAKISIKIFFKTNAKRDADNYPCKEVIDAIKNNSLIIDDNYDVIGRVDINIMGRDRNNPHTEITIKEI